MYALFLNIPHKILQWGQDRPPCSPLGGMPPKFLVDRKSDTESILINLIRTVVKNKRRSSPTVL